MKVFSAGVTAGSENGSGELVIKACDMCRKKKIRCVLMQEGGCAQCNKHNANCNFTPIKVKRAPRRPPGHKHVEELERRLKRMEALLQGQGSAQGAVVDVEMGHQTGQGNLGRKKKAPHSLPNSPEQHDVQEQKRIRISGTLIHGTSGSPSPAEQISRALVEIDSPFSVPHWKLTGVSSVFDRRTFKQLPPKHDALLLIQEAFQNFNAAFPIFDEESFLGTFEAHYSASDKRDDPGWWACLNVVFALAHRFRAMRALDSRSEDEHAWGYLQNALAVVTELTMLHSELFAVQAIIGMAIVLEGTPNPQPCTMLISAALKLAQSMNLHRREQEHHLSAAEVEQRKRVFWIAYFLDRDISMRTGQPPAQDDDDMDVDLPTETIELEPVSGHSVNFFNLRIGLAIIQGQIYKRLYSVKAQRLSEIERGIAAEELDVMLDAWKKSVPIDFVHDNLATTLADSDLPTVVHTVIIKFTYLNALNAIRRFHVKDSLFHIESSEPIVQAQSKDVSIDYDAICVTEARTSLQLFQTMPQGNYAYCWILLHIIVSASTTILSHIISDSAHSRANEDLKLVHPLLKLLKVLGKEGRNTEVERMEKSLGAMWREARVAVDGIRGHEMKEVHSGGKVGNDNGSLRRQKESVHDFISRIERIAAGFEEDGEVLSPD